MKTIKETINALAKQDGVEIYRNRTIEEATCGEVDKQNNACDVYLRLNEPVLGMVRVTKRYLIDKAEEIEEMKANLENIADGDEKKEFEKKIKDAESALSSLAIDDYTKDKTTRIKISNFDVIAMLKRNPALQSLAEIVAIDESWIKGLLNAAKCSFIGEDVFKDQEYIGPFSSSDNTYKVPNTSVYFTPFNLSLSEYGEDTADEIREIRREIRKEELKERLRSKGSAKKPARKETYNDDAD